MVDENALPDNPPGRSGGRNTLVWVLAIAAVGLVVCCGGLGVVAWKAKDFVANMASSDPVEVRRQTAEMVEISIPDKFQPMQAMNMVALRMVMYQTDAAANGSRGMLMLMEMAIQPKGVTPQQQEDQLRQSMQQQQGNQGFQSSKSETREIEIRGEKVPFEFREGTNASGGQKMHMVSGVFRGKRGPVMLQLVIPADEYDEDAVIEMLQSIQ